VHVVAARAGDTPATILSTDARVLQTSGAGGPVIAAALSGVS
jgi:hypothetical protein